MNEQESKDVVGSLEAPQPVASQVGAKLSSKLAESRQHPLATSAESLASQSTLASVEEHSIVANSLANSARTTPDSSADRTSVESLSQHSRNVGRAALSSAAVEQPRKNTIRISLAKAKSVVATVPSTSAVSTVQPMPPASVSDKIPAEQREQRSPRRNATLHHPSPSRQESSPMRRSPRAPLRVPAQTLAGKPFRAVMTVLSPPVKSLPPSVVAATEAKGANGTSVAESDVTYTGGQGSVSATTTEGQRQKRAYNRRTTPGQQAAPVSTAESGPKPKRKYTRRVDIAQSAPEKASLNNDMDSTSKSQQPAKRKYNKVVVAPKERERRSITTTPINYAELLQWGDDEALSDAEDTLSPDTLQPPTISSRANDSPPKIIVSTTANGSMMVKARRGRSPSRVDDASIDDADEHTAPSPKRIRLLDDALGAIEERQRAQMKDRMGPPPRIGDPAEYTAMEADASAIEE